MAACVTNQFTFSTTIPDISYTTDLGTLTKGPFSTSQTNENCNFAVTYSLAIA